MNIKSECSTCKVAKFCERKGSSPAITKSGKDVKCVLIGGYTVAEIPDVMLSEESKAKVLKNGGRFLTIAEVPTVIGNDVFYQVEKIFSPPVRHERSTSTYHIDGSIPRSNKPL